jgi:hypothetical protein
MGLSLMMYFPSVCRPLCRATEFPAIAVFVLRQPRAFAERSEQVKDEPVNVRAKFSDDKATILLQLLDFALEFRFVLKAIVTGQATHDFAAFPILEDTAQVFAGNSGHGREVALPDLVLNNDAVRSDIPPEMFRQFEQRKATQTLQRRSSQQRPPRWSHVGVG